LSAAAAFPIFSARLHTTVGAELGALAEQLRRVTLRIHTSAARHDGVGAGVLWPAANRGIVLTNAHVVPERRRAAPRVEDADGRLADARVIARDEDLDLALLEIAEEPNDWPPALIGDARTLRVGEIVVALGHPFGVDGALSLGVLQAVPNGDDAWVRADILLAPGNSGGPLATLDGAVIGINCMVARGLGIAVPAHVAEQFVRATLDPASA
jgi:serine protease Do